MGEVLDARLEHSLEKFQDWGFGLLMHWGIYSVWGSVESWPIEPVEGYGRQSLPQWQESGHDLNKFRKMYFDLAKKFNPVEFDPHPWAEAAKRAGMKYVIFTTKHHDGFCMFDTKQTDFRITNPNYPFHADPRADIAKVVFDAFRMQGLGVGAYFSKPDWHCPDFWDPNRPIKDKYPNYDPAKEKDRWQRYVRYTYAQVEELMTRYGPLDILWFDGAWISPPKYDVDMDSIARMARSHNPDVLVVDRWITGPNEDYLTPEQKIPPKPLDTPWESCITMGAQWSWRPNESYKSVPNLVQMLVDVSAKGGNLLLNIGPDALGRWDDTAYQRLRGMARWMKLNDQAIHGTRPIKPYTEDQWRFTHNDKSVFAIYLPGPAETAVPGEVTLKAFKPKGDSAPRLLGFDGQIGAKLEGDTLRITIPEPARQALKDQPAWVIAIDA